MSMLEQRRAKCAWVSYVAALLDELAAPEYLDECMSALGDLSDEERAEHLKWRDKVGDALRQELHLFCPSSGECCDAIFWSTGGEKGPS